MEKQFEMVISEEMGGMEFLGIIDSPFYEKLKIGVFQETNYDYPNPHIIRVYQFENDLVDESYIPSKELEAFAFTTEEQAKNFAVRLPQMSALDYLILINSRFPEEIQ